MRVKKSNLMKLFRLNYKCLTTVFICFVLVFSMSLDVFAQNYRYYDNLVAYGGTGSYESAGSLASVFNLESENGIYPYLKSDVMRSYYGGSGSVSLGGNNASGFLSSTDTRANGFFDSSSSYSFFVPTSITASSHKSDIALNGGYTVCTYAPNTADSQKFVCNFRFNSLGNVRICTFPSSPMMVVSDQPLYYMLTSGVAYYGATTQVQVGLVDEANIYGFYCFEFDSYYDVVFADCVINAYSSDGASGYTGWSDFSMSDDNTNFNILLLNDIVSDPMAPSESEIEKVSKSNMIFTSNDYWSGDTLTGMYHTYNFNPNNYMREHGEQFQIVVKHRATYRDNTMQTAVNFTFPDYTVKVDMLMAGSRDGTFTIPLDLHNMVDENNVSIRQYLLTTINTVSDTNEEFLDINSMGEQEQTSGADGGNYLSGGPSGDSWVDSNGVRHMIGSPSNKKVILKSVYENYVEDFTIYADIFVRSAPPDYNYESDYDSTHYNVKNGGFGIDKNGGSTQLYPPEEGSGVVTPTIPSYPSGGGNGVSVSGGSISNILKELATATSQAIIQSGAIQNTNNVSPQQTAYGGSIESGAVVVQTGGHGFQISDRSWNEFGTLLESMANDLTTIQNEPSSQSFLSVISNVYSVLPARVWTIIFMGLTGSVVIALWNRGSHSC